MLTGQPHDPCHKTALIIGNMPLPSLCVPMLPKHETCPAFAQSITAESTFCLSTARRRGEKAQKLSCAAQRRPDAASRNARVEFCISEQPLQPRVLLPILSRGMSRPTARPWAWDNRNDGWWSGSWSRESTFGMKPPILPAGQGVRAQLRAVERKLERPETPLAADRRGDTAQHRSP